MTSPTTLEAPGADDARTTSRNAAEVIAATAVRLGAEHLFALMGGTNMRVVHGFHDEGVPLHHFRHENGAVGAADGYARATGSVGWASIIHGPGFTNGLTALRTAFKAHTPVVLVMADTMNSPQRSTPFESGIQGLAPDAILAELGVPVVRVTAATAAQDTVTAYLSALRNQSPVALVIPHGVEAERSDSDIDAAVAALPGAPSPVVPSGAAIDAAERAIRDARQLVVMAGRGATDPETVALLERLAELTGAYLGTSVRGVGAFDRSPASLGIFGGFTHEAGTKVIYDSDCIVAFGAGLNHLQTRRSTYLAGSTVVHVDSDAKALGRFDRADVPVHGDAALVARALVARFEERPLEPARPLPTAPAREEHADVSEPFQLDPRALAKALDRVLPQDRTVVVDGGHFTVWPIYYMHHATPDSLMWTCDFGAMGCGLGPSLGAVIGRDDRLTALFIGDCGFMMSIGDLEVAVRERLPLLVVCFNDGAAGSEIVLSDIAGLPSDEAIFGVADLAKVAAGLGAASAVIAELDDLEPALAAWDRQGPLFLDCRITRSVRSHLYAQYA